MPPAALNGRARGLVPAGCARVPHARAAGHPKRATVQNGPGGMVPRRGPAAILVGPAPARPLLISPACPPSRSSGTGPDGKSPIRSAMRAHAIPPGQCDREVRQTLPPVRRQSPGLSAVPHGRIESTSRAAFAAPPPSIVLHGDRQAWRYKRIGTRAASSNLRRGRRGRACRPGWPPGGVALRPQRGEAAIARRPKPAVRGEGGGDDRRVRCAGRPSEPASSRAQGRKDRRAGCRQRRARRGMPQGRPSRSAARRRGAGPAAWAGRGGGGREEVEECEGCACAGPDAAGGRPKRVRAADGRALARGAPGPRPTGRMPPRPAPPRAAPLGRGPDGGGRRRGKAPRPPPRAAPPESRPTASCTRTSRRRP